MNTPIKATPKDANASLKITVGKDGKPLVVIDGWDIDFGSRVATRRGVFQAVVDWATASEGKDADNRQQARDLAHSNRAGPSDYRASDYDRMIPQTDVAGNTYYVKVNMLDYIQE